MGLLVPTNSRGFTLIEVLVAILIMMVGLLALLQMVNVSIVHNMANQIRNDSVLVADEQMALEMTKPFNLISTNATAHIAVVQRSINNAFNNYSVTKTGANVSNSTKSVSILVKWHYKGQTYSHSIGSMISNTQ